MIWLYCKRESGKSQGPHERGGKPARDTQGRPGPFASPAAMREKEGRELGDGPQGDRLNCSKRKDTGGVLRFLTQGGRRRFGLLQAKLAKL